MDNILEKIKTKQAKIGVIGLGYVGLPLAVLLAKKGFAVTGYVRTRQKAESIAKGKSNLADPALDKALQAVLKSNRLHVTRTERKSLEEQDVFIICVPTPVTETKTPDITDLLHVRDALQEIDLAGKLLINESTVAPFTTREVFGNFPGKYFLVSSPERIDPGNRTKTVENIPKVIGGIDKESLLLGKALYSQILSEHVVLVNSLEGAEMAKILENTYRAVNIALSNEFAKLAEQCGVDILEVINAAKTKWSFQAHYPGIGVGGHCMPVDPYYLLELAEKKGVMMHVVAHALEVNRHMPEHVAEKVLRVYKKNMKVLVYGITYKKDINDLRESPVLEFCKILTKKHIPFRVYDPYITADTIKALGLTRGTLTPVDVVIVGTDHTHLSTDIAHVLKDDTIIIDGRNFFKEKQGKQVIGVGRSL